MSRSRRDAGFTLIELVIALALTALVSLLLLHGIRLAVAGLDRHTRQVERLDDRRSLDELLRRAFGSAAPGPGFAGRSDGVRFLSLAEDGGPGLYRVEIALADGKLMVRRRLAEPSGDPRIAQSVLAAGVRSFRLAYFGARATTDEPAWQQSWQESATPPRLVRVILATDSDPPRPPLVIPIWSAGS